MCIFLAFARGIVGVGGDLGLTGRPPLGVVCFQMQAVSQGSKFEAEIREEKEERKRQEVEKKQRQAAFKQLQSAFCS